MYDNRLQASVVLKYLTEKENIKESFYPKEDI